MNIEVARVQYELLGHTPQQIADQFDVDVGVVEYAITTQNWKPRPLADATALVESGEDKALDSITALSIVKDATLLPNYIALETAILTKAREVVENMDPINPICAESLQKIEKIFSSLANTQSLFARVKASKDGDVQDNRVQVVIQNKV